MLAPDFALLSDRLTPFLELFDNLKLQEEEIETKNSLIAKQGPIQDGCTHWDLTNVSDY